MVHGSREPGRGPKRDALSHEPLIINDLFDYLLQVSSIIQCSKKSKVSKFSNFQVSKFQSFKVPKFQSFRISKFKSSCSTFQISNICGTHIFQQLCFWDCGISQKYVFETWFGIFIDLCKVILHEIEEPCQVISQASKNTKLQFISSILIMSIFVTNHNAKPFINRRCQ